MGETQCQTEGCSVADCPSCKRFAALEAELAEAKRDTERAMERAMERARTGYVWLQVASALWDVADSTERREAFENFGGPSLVANRSRGLDGLFDAASDFIDTVRSIPSEGERP